MVRSSMDLDARLEFDHGDVEVLERTAAFEGFFRMDQLTLRHRLFSGEWSAPMRRELFVRGPAVVLLPWDPDRDELVMVEQFRVGSIGMGPSPWQMEFVAGMVEDGETPEQVAMREAQEEAGIEVRDLVPVHRYQVSPGGNSEEILIYCGRVDASTAVGVHGLESEFEDIRVHRVQFADAVASMEAGQVRNAAGIVGIQWLMLHRETLRQRWNS